MALRVQAEEHARRQTPSREVTLEEIYEVLGEWLDLGSDGTGRAICMELALERAVIRPVPGASDRIQQVRDMGNRVVYASEMYLPASFIQEQLERHGFWQGEDACYVSCEFRRAKSTGELFHDIMTGESVSPQRMEHWGDNPVSDVRAASRAGIQSFHFSQGGLNRFEHILESFASETKGLSSVFAGASRLARLESSDRSDYEQTIARVAAGVAAPVLTAYTLWLLRRALDLGLERIYFVSRDGEILLDIARKLTAALGIEIDCRYLYGSRQAWHVASIVDEVQDVDLQWILEPSTRISVRSVMGRVGLTPECVKRELESVGLDVTTWDRNLSQRERGHLRSAILMPSVAARIQERAEQAREVAIDYLRQEGLLDPLRMAIVDLGWRGRQMRSLSKLLQYAGGTLPTPFFFGLIAGSQSEALADREAYLFDMERQLGLDTNTLHPRIWNLLEAFCAGYEGTATGYRQANGTVSANLLAATNGPVIDWGLPVLRGTVAAFVTHATEGLRFVEPWSDFRPAVHALLAEFWERPTRSEALVWGAFPYQDGQIGSDSEQLATPVTWTNIGRAIQDMREWRRYCPIWMAGSIAISPIGIRAALSLMMRARPALLYLKRRARGRDRNRGLSVNPIDRRANTGR